MAPDAKPVGSDERKVPSIYDLVIHGGKVIDPAAAISDVYDIAFRDGRVDAIEKTIDPRQSKEAIDAHGYLVVPGLVDLHTHIYRGGTSLGVDACSVCEKSGTTTFVDAGSAGAGNFAGFRRFIADATELNIYAFLNISYAGIFGFMPQTVIGECRNLRLLDTNECTRAIEENRDLIVGIKVRVGKEASGRNGTRPLELARDVADLTGLPIMVHVDIPPPDLRDVMALLRRGDIWTHCFRPEPNSIVSSAGDVEDEIVAAKKRGVLFDVGHGYGSFSFAVAGKMLDRGLYPDTISSDVHKFSITERARDLLHTASKFLILGMPLEEVVGRITALPAAAIGQYGLGTLTPGSRGDAIVLEEEQGSFVFTDSTAAKITGDRRLRVKTIICNGRLWNKMANSSSRSTSDRE